MIQDFYIFFFANITASYVNRRTNKTTETNKKQNKQEVRMEYKIIPIV